MPLITAGRPRQRTPMGALSQQGCLLSFAPANVLNHMLAKYSGNTAAVESARRCAAAAIHCDRECFPDFARRLSQGVC